MAENLKYDSLQLNLYEAKKEEPENPSRDPDKPEVPPMEEPPEPDRERPVEDPKRRKEPPMEEPPRDPDEPRREPPEKYSSGRVPEDVQGNK
ncbi:MAG: hypothetical protein GF404_07800 [candidate division Zixibacteria bacterium]|nr:hypothetical protein [candidate division Zixibacteria bacterium]